MTPEFILAAALMLVAVLAVLLRVLWRRAAPAPEPAAAVDMRVYRDQLREIERDAARGVIPASEADSLRAEIARRLLEADRALASGPEEPAQPASSARPRALALVLVVVLGGGTAAIYQSLGAPGYGDLSLRDRIAAAEARRADRPSQAEAEAEALAAGVIAPPQTPEPGHADLLAQLRATLETRPDDLRGWEILARNEAGLGNLSAAAAAQAQVVRLRGDALRPTDLSLQLEFLLGAAGGYVSPEAEAVLNRLLALAPADPPGRFYQGLLQIQIGRYDLAFTLWERLLREGPPDAPWITPIRQQIEDLAYLAGQHRYELPPAAAPAAPGAAMRGPSADDIAAAADMSAEDRMTMIRTMVSGLAERLATEGGPASEWARLIAAYGVLGETANARTIATEALGVFAERPEDLQLIREAARRAGVAE